MRCDERGFKGDEVGEIVRLGKIPEQLKGGPREGEEVRSF